jgi:predicted nucleic acid-binding protein
VSRVFVDTSALLALLDAADARHEATKAAFAEMALDDFVTHGYVVAESIAVARRRFGVDGVNALLDDLLPIVDLVPVDPSLHTAALARYRAALPSGTSFVNQVSLAVITRERVDAVFALDDDLAAAGVRLVPETGRAT